MDWRDIPSLAALRAFEAAARTHSFSAAARELNVTHAAIAQHVRALEDHFGVPLMERQGRTMRPTPPGARLAKDLGDGFGTIAAGVRTLADSRRVRPVQVTLTPSFAAAWLMPRMGQFWAEHPEIEVALVPSNAVVDLRRDGYDIAIRFGDGNWPGLEVEPLEMSPFVIVAAPALAQERTLDQMGPLDEYRWFMSDAAKEQSVWGRAAGVDMTRMKVSQMADNALVLAAVRAGHGLSIQAQTLVQPDLDDGRLVVLLQGENEGLGYHLVRPRGPESTAVSAFVKWLRRA